MKRTQKMMAVLSASVLLGSAVVTPTVYAAETNTKQETTQMSKLVNEYMALVKNTTEPKEVMAFLDKNLPQASKEDAFMITRGLEGLQKSHKIELRKSCKELGKNEEVLKALKDGWNLEKVKAIKDEKVKNFILEDVYENGFVLTNEKGEITPEVSVEIAKKYAPYLNIMERFAEVIHANSKPCEVIAFMDENIVKVSKEDAATMVKGLETSLKNQVAALQKKYEDPKVQKELKTIFANGISTEAANKIKSEETLMLVLGDTYANGLKLEKVDGVFTPVVDTKVATQYDQYIKIMDTYMALLHTDISSKELMNFADRYISRVSQEDAFMMIKGIVGMIRAEKDPSMVKEIEKYNIYITKDMQSLIGEITQRIH